MKRAGAAVVRGVQDVGRRDALGTRQRSDDAIVLGKQEHAAGIEEDRLRRTVLVHVVSLSRMPRRVRLRMWLHSPATAPPCSAGGIGISREQMAQTLARFRARVNSARVVAWSRSPTSTGAFPANARACVPSSTMPSLKQARTSYQSIADRSREDSDA